MSAIDPAQFRSVLGRFPTGVAVITATGPQDRPAGMACNSFTSVSLDPPLVLFGAAVGSATLPVIRESGRFCVNVLGVRHERLCRQFAARGVDRFADVRWTPSPWGPQLSEAIARIDCAVTAEHPAGDHLVVIGRVVRLAATGDEAPLVFHRGRYGSFAATADLLG
ncbi:flavin reductase family protein [Saccharopolyspora hirsuta]|uniref:Flavin reductase family protein n=1 Tax=Saccharopolyspora hirsuta TaxID=1837 RepID=A0A5M7C3A6_SACHI|nr:flavin reductase family protein [Saccharopolyspora hirsuta]KAA5834957.1 flavin reductase family protein [Saccharopolyspora hirsuta]